MDFFGDNSTNLSSCWIKRGEDEVHYWFGVIIEHHKHARDGRDGCCAYLLSGHHQRNAGASIYIKREGQAFSFINTCQPGSQRNLKETCWEDSINHEESIADISLCDILKIIYYIMALGILCALSCWELSIKIFIFPAAVE